ncbi:uncharacterized protein LOC133842000 [Drosophila sulfurigaster albostrigata]|uniref:uncharacterized protein LOC133842000 n=1 Tax=Drosophila sulfurigaster albostrigata TaxID=89887 RepID=UPI002D218E73|nr:uncharacterized protein LOC133842000 [Drosophila sulfurigaster albostrigata]
MFKNERKDRILFFWLLLSSLILLSQTKKEIYFADARCFMTGNKIANATCGVKDRKSLYLVIQTKNVLVSLVGISRLTLNTIGSKNAITLNGVRLDICQILAGAFRPSLLSFINQGLRDSFVEFPKKCPLKADTTYRAHNISFDTSAVPRFTPDYNFTFSAIFMANNVASFEYWCWGVFN